MKEFLRANQTAGLFIDNHQLKIAQLVAKNREIEIHHLETFFLTIEEGNENEHVKRLYKVKNAEIPAEIGKNFLPVGALDGIHTLVRTLNIKIGKQKEIDAVLEFQAEPYIPFPFDQALLESQTVSLNNSGSQVTLLASQKEHVAELIDLYKQIGIDLEIIESLPSSLAHFGYHYCFKNSNRSYFVLHIGKLNTECVLAKEGTLIASHAIENGIKLLNSIEEKQSFLKEILKTQSALSKQSKKFHPTQLLVVGEGANDPLLMENLAKELNLELCSPFLAENISLSDFNSYSAAIALALSAQQKATHQINFRQKEFSYPNPWKRLKKTTFFYLGASLFCAAALYFFSLQWQHHKEQEIRGKYAELLESSNRGYTNFEMRFLKEKKKIANILEKNIQKPQNLSIQEITERLQFLHSELTSTPSLFNLHPKPARVSDLLAYLATHQNVVDENGEALIEIEAISYTMTKRPTDTNKKQSYQFRIEIEFTTPIPKIAREFHDALIKENDFVDPKEEVKWSASSDRYKASFFLRDRKPIKKGS